MISGSCNTFLVLLLKIVYHAMLQMTN